MTHGRGAVAALALALAPGTAMARAEHATMRAVVDADSIRVVTSHGIRTVDLLGVRAPARGECFAGRARLALARLLPRGTRLVVERDPRAAAGRYVLRGSTLLNAVVLEQGIGFPSGLRGLRRAAALRRAARAGLTARHGVHGCTAPDGSGAPETASGDATGPTPVGTGEPAPEAPAPPPPPPPVPGPAEDAAVVHDALVGGQLTAFNSDQSSSSKDTTRFCDQNRAARTEERNSSETGFTLVSTVGSWTVMAAERHGDGSFAATVAFTPDDPSLATRLVHVAIAADKTVTDPTAKTSELKSGGSCAAAQPSPGFENDTAAARSGVIQALEGHRIGESSAFTDLCSGPHATWTRDGAVVLDGGWTVGWATTDATTTTGLMTLIDSVRHVSRRLLVVIKSGQPAALTDLGALANTAHDVTLEPGAC
jgi:hypothetical protein